MGHYVIEKNPLADIGGCEGLPDYLAEKEAAGYELVAVVEHAGTPHYLFRADGPPPEPAPAPELELPSPLEPDEPEPPAPELDEPDESPFAEPEPDEPVDEE